MSIALNPVVPLTTGITEGPIHYVTGFTTAVIIDESILGFGADTADGQDPVARPRK